MSALAKPGACGKSELDQNRYTALYERRLLCRKHGEPTS